MKVTIKLPAQPKQGLRLNDLTDGLYSVDLHDNTYVLVRFGNRTYINTHSQLVEPLCELNWTGDTFTKIEGAEITIIP